MRSLVRSSVPRFVGIKNWQDNGTWVFGNTNHRICPIRHNDRRPFRQRRGVIEYNDTVLDNTLYFHYDILALQFIIATARFLRVLILHGIVRTTDGALAGITAELVSAEA